VSGICFVSVIADLRPFLKASTPASKPEAQAEGSYVLRSANRIPSARASGFKEFSSAQRTNKTRIQQHPSCFEARSAS
jgi:hypothetical protein